MASAIYLVELFGGLIYLLLAGDLLVRGSVAMSKRAGIPPIVAGLTIVAFGTSAPELFISIGSAMKGVPEVAIGNVVGSNIANVLLVLGLPALFYPTLCDREALGPDCLMLLAGSLLFVVLCFLGPIGFAQGAVLFAMILVVLVRSARHTSGDPEAEEAAAEELERGLGLPTQRRMIALFLLLGLVGLPLGAHLMVEGGVQLASRLGVSNAVIGLSVIALGTSLPELATTLLAALHRHSDVALGNILGSNLFNILAVMGLTAMVAPAPIPVPPSFLSFDLLVMMAAAVVLAYLASVKGYIGRRSGLVLLASYALYMVILFSFPETGGAPPMAGR
jgi:cation:H+ antiporter